MQYASEKVVNITYLVKLKILKTFEILLKKKIFF